MSTSLPPSPASPTLSPGARLGAGGMGEVYRARDTRLGREVAIKTVSLRGHSHPDSVLRFEQEARSASALNHPNIVTIHELGSANGIEYIGSQARGGEGAGMSRGDRRGGGAGRALIAPGGSGRRTSAAIGCAVFAPGTVRAGAGARSRALSDSAAKAAWMEGWTTPVEQAVDEALSPPAASAATGGKAPNSTGEAGIN